MLIWVNEVPSLLCAWPSPWSKDLSLGEDVETSGSAAFVWSC